LRLSVEKPRLDLCAEREKLGSRRHEAGVLNPCL
jgi:hypothetical protein